MRRKAKPIWWLMALGAIATIALGAWFYYHQASAPVKNVARQVTGQSTNHGSGLLLDDAQEECGIVADYARNKRLENVVSILQRGSFKMDGVSTEGDSPLDCGAAFHRAGLVTADAPANGEASNSHLVIFSRIYRESKASNYAFFLAYDPCGLCGHGWHVDLQRVSGKWIVIGEVQEWVS